jgi:hypothetical protein
MSKAYSEFYRNKRYKDGFSYECKECRKIYLKKRKSYDSASRKDYYEAVKHTEEYYYTYRNRHLKHKYGISINDYNNMVEEQGSSCAICSQKFDLSDQHVERKHSLVVDHCHKTGVVRGLLCDKCNRGLGYFKDSPSFLKEAIRYLNEHSDEV